MYRPMILFCVAGLVWMSLIGSSQAANVTIYTKNFAPFSLNGEGYSIDYMKEVLGDIYGTSGLVVDTVVLANNDAIFAAVLNHSATTTNFAAGTAGISITGAREALVDFLPPFFQSGMQVLVHSSTNFDDVVSRVVRNVFIAFGFLLLGIAVFIYTFAPLAWFFELGFSGDEIPIFIDWNSRKTKRPKWKRVGIEIFNAFRWTGLTLMGVDTGYPESVGAQWIHSFLKIMRIVIFMVGTAAFGTVMQVSTQTTHINGYNDLGGQVVCTVHGTTPQQFITQNNVGFQIVTSPDLDSMFDNFWGGVCSAVVYDFPALQNAIVEREQNHGNSNAVIVGPVFNKESYGIAVSPSLPGALEETLKQAVINLNNDHDRIAILTNKWFSKIEGTTGDNEIKVPVALIVVPCVLGIGILIVAVSWLYRNYEEKDENYEFRRREKNDNNYKDDLEELLQEEADNETIYRGDDWLLDKVVVPKVIRTLRVVYSMFLTLVENRKDEVEEVESRHLPKRVGTMAKALHDAGLGRQETAIMEEDQKARTQLDYEVEMPRM